MVTVGKLFFVGRVTRPHGVRGEVKVLEGEGSSGAWRLAKEVLIGKEPERVERWKVRGVREGGRFALLALEGIDDQEQARGLMSMAVYVDSELLPPLEEGSFYAGELLGIEVRDREGRLLGRLKEIFDNGAHEVYVVGDRSREVLIPVVEGVVLDVDLGAGRLVVDPPAGLPGLFESE